MTLNQIKSALRSYLNANGLKADTITGMKAEHAFICGIQAATKDELPAYVTICALSGRSILR